MSEEDGRQVEQREVGREEDRRLGVTQELNRQVLHPMGLTLAWAPDGTLRLLDCRSAGGAGLVYGDLGQPAYEAAGVFRRLQGELLMERRKQLGWVRQPIPRAGPTPATGPWGKPGGRAS